MKFLFLALLVSCSANTKDVTRVLEQDGCKNVIDNGWHIFGGCSEKDSFTNRFTCKKNEKQIEGVICSGWFKGYTIRYF